MRAVVLALSLALVGATVFPEFSAGKTYVYMYEMSVINGLPEEGLARAKMNASCKFLISAFDKNTYMLKVEDVMMQEFTGFWPKEHAESIGNIPKAFTPEFNIPIKFEYSNGVVGKVYAPEGVSDLVLNFYRAVLNIIQLNIKKTHNVYDLQETGIQGVCKTLYSVNEDVKAERIHLTKTRDMNHCQERVYRDMGLAYTEKCDKCQQESKNLRGSTSYRYTLKPVLSGVMILEADVNELIQFSPFSESYGAAQTETKQTFVFQEIQDSSIAPISAEYHHRGSLKYEFTNDFEWTPLQLVNVTDEQAQVLKELLNHLVTHNAEKVTDHAPLKYLELVEFLRLARYEDLEAFWSKYRDTLWLLEAIPATGTSAALRFIKEKFTSEDLSVTEAVRTLVAAVHMVTANPESIKLFEVYSKLNANPVLREIVFLGYGTMISKYCAESDVCPVEYIKPIQKRLSEAVSKGETEDIILYVKVLGNAGHPSSLKSITKIMPIHGTAAASLPITVHIEAIMALRNIAKKEPRMVQELALQLYMDKALDPELRMLSCIVLFETNPSMALISTLANAVKSEENLQVASFTYSHMKSLSRSASMIHPSVAAACNVAMKILSPKLDRLSLRYSKAVYGEAYSSSFMLGAAATAFYINDAATFLPRSVVAKTKAFFVGAAADVLEIGVRTDGLQETLLKNPSVLKSGDRITKMKRVIKALSQWRSLPNNKPLASFYIKLFGQEIAFANIDKPMVEQAIALASGPSVQAFGVKALKTLLLSGVSFNYTMPVMYTEMRRAIPTATGISVQLSLFSAAVAGAVVKIEPTLLPHLPEDFPLSRLLETDIKLETEIRPSFAMDTYAVMGINNPFYHAIIVSRAKFNSTLPSKISARLDIKEGDFKIELEERTQTHFIFSRGEQTGTYSSHSPCALSLQRSASSLLLQSGRYLTCSIQGGGCKHTYTHSS
uniref:Vitellogenin domain-containing protein n=1 Tax=Oryzias latipes TaxID=8090 RepID=A0A3B3H6D5_ORYLA